MLRGRGIEIGRVGLLSLALGALAVLALAPMPTARAQEPEAPAPGAPQPAERVRAVAEALAALADNAELGAWQAADDAFNRTLDALDAHRAPLETELGEVAQTALAELAAALPDLDAALAAEDAPTIRALVTRLTAQLVTLSPDASLPAAAPASQPARAVLAWRDALVVIRQLEVAEAWRDMRNAAIDLLDGIARQAPTLTRDAGPEVSTELDRLRVFALRLRAAALDQSHEEGERAARLFDGTLDRLLVAQGILPAPTARAVGETGTRFRAFEVVAAVGERVRVPIVAEGLPDVGLGGFRLRAQWSPEALALVDAVLENGSGEIVRDDEAGTVELALNQAPIGPTGDAIVATLTIDARSAHGDPEAYLPAAELQALRQLGPQTLAQVRLGDVPKAGSALSRAYAGFLEGRDQPGSLYAALDADGISPAPIAEALLRALDAASRPGETDEIVETIGAIDRAVDGAVTAHFAVLGGDDGVPIALEVLSATDTTGAPIALQPASFGRVLVGSDMPPTREAMPTAADMSLSGAASPTASVLAAQPTAVELAPAPRGGVPPPVPRALVAALIIASAIGLVATWTALRRVADEASADEDEDGD